MKTHNKRTRSILTNRVEIPLCTVRDHILERDDVYRDNITSLLHRIQSRKVGPEMLPRIQPFLAMAALRRAGVNLNYSRRMLLA
jgi:hypothetical protein